MGWRVTLVVEPGCGEDFRSNLINIECNDLKEGQEIAKNITPLGSKVQELITETDENGEPSCWLKIPEGSIKSVWVWFISDEEEEEEEEEDEEE
ncbi:hypothetical protein NIES2119_31450 [[Phormidium ambiguum] IAM M-71]|uniref:Uncharacterized protein n=1 Tax=[Phormidium ambiguum] IAM M-71 TaxID=454136 RepID=A0A1U7I290_9CYAN|nr:hypothetical protein [Phormidium ambiguum]OKH30187.1 hypothetical protein NIES2119_31450 [Phormidium ambiguum IAM M-71]